VTSFIAGDEEERGGLMGTEMICLKPVLAGWSMTR
jgi:hypothetical protein